MKKIRNILVTDGNSRAALAITRSLGSKGYKLFVGERVKPSLASSSKYCNEAVLYPDPVNEYDKFCKAIKEKIDILKIDLIIPVTDICIFPISNMVKDGVIENKTQLANDDSMKLAANKSELTKQAAGLGVPVPLSQIIESKNNIAVQNLKIPYPVVVKPSRSRVMVDGKWIFTSVTYAGSYEELRSILEKTNSEVFPIILQERVRGKGIGAFYCYDKGRCIAKFSHRRIREKPPSGGVSVLRESVEIDPDIDRYSQILLKKIKWHGVAMVEYKYDDEKAIPYFMEINGRFWGSLQLAIDAGVDFPNILADISQNIDIGDATNYKIGVKTRWLWGDLDLLLMLVIKSRSQLKLPDDYGPKWKVIASILNPFGKNLHYEVLSFKDIKPWFHESRQWISNLVK
ncbi:ATP-grasp domain-containing protein [Candidatus Thiodiazotropha sp. LNASS1]|uniref:carboxylate--amine ligase n=1 Tax=Candidatus Thiodiazotropha sp. LNASS1 TaxID=3096260 RepID=UPI003489371D